MNRTPSLPQWAKHAVWYQIFPERFRNGDPNNDPTSDDLRGAYPHEVNAPWQIKPYFGFVNHYRAKEL